MSRSDRRPTFRLPFHLRAGLAALLALLAWPLPAQAGPPRVAADIAPVHSLVARVMAGAGTPALVMQPGASPHGHAMRPSEARSLAEADLVVWVGPQLTPALGRAAETLASGAEVLTLIEAPGMRLIPMRESAAFAPHDHGGGDHGGHDHGHGHGHDQGAEDADGAPERPIDPHIWLDPRNAAAAAGAVAGALARLDPENADLYRRNAEALATELEALAERIERRLAPVQDRPFVVFHDAYHYFEARFGVEAAGAVSLSDATSPGPARVAAVRERLAELEAACLFSEPQFPPRLMRTIAEGLAVRTGTLDPVGIGLEPGPDLYPRLLEGLAEDLATCLSATG